VIKSYKTREVFEIESQALKILKDAKVSYFVRMNYIEKNIILFFCYNVEYYANGRCLSTANNYCL
jgi:hypothetical protein